MLKKMLKNAEKNAVADTAHSGFGGSFGIISVESDSRNHDLSVNLGCSLTVVEAEGCEMTKTIKWIKTTY